MDENECAEPKDLSSTMVYLASEENLFDAEYFYETTVEHIGGTTIIAKFEGVVAGEYYVFINILNMIVIRLIKTTY